MTTITSVYPSSGPTTGGTLITITGTGFNFPFPVTSLTIGGVAATSISVISNTSILAVTPQGVEGTQELILVTLLGSATSYFTYRIIPPPPYCDICPAPPYNATNFTSANSVEFSTLQSYANDAPNYPWNTGTDAQQIYRSRQNISYFSGFNQRTLDIKTMNNLTGNPHPQFAYPQFKSQAERLMYIQGQTLTAARMQISGKNPSAPAGVPCSTNYNIIYPYP